MEQYISHRPAQTNAIVVVFGILLRCQESRINPASNPHFYIVFDLLSPNSIYRFQEILKKFILKWPLKFLSERQIFQNLFVADLMYLSMMRDGPLAKSHCIYTKFSRSEFILDLGKNHRKFAYQEVSKLDAKTPRFLPKFRSLGQADHRLKRLCLAY